jgi:uncharacterized protein (TIGR00730 family)
MKRTPEEQAQWLSELPSHRTAFEDVDFLHRDELRPVRLQLELLKPELLQQEQGIVSTIVVFGSARTTSEGIGGRYYDEARKFAAMVSEHCQARGIRKFVITTGGGPGIMEAANRGAHDVGAKSIGLNIEIPSEQVPNPYITPELCFSFHYFALRKMHFLLRAKALVIFPGGFGTLDELFDALTLIQTKKMDPMPVVLVGREYWDNVLNLEYMVEQGTVSAEDLDIISHVDDAEEAWQVIRDAYPEELG